MYIASSELCAAETVVGTHEMPGSRCVWPGKQWKPRNMAVDVLSGGGRRAAVAAAPGRGFGVAAVAPRGCSTVCRVPSREGPASLAVDDVRCPGYFVGVLRHGASPGLCCSQCERTAGPSREACPGMHGGGGGGTPPPPLQGAQPMPSHCPPDGKCQPQWHS